MALRNVLVFGGKGALGGAVINSFIRDKWQVANIDVTPVDNAALGNVTISPTATLEETSEAVLKALEGKQFDAVINVAGGWAGGDVKDPKFVANTDLMIRQSIYSSTIAAHVAATLGKEDCLLVLPGAAAALKPTSFMAGYGMAKAAVHHLIKSAAADPASLPKNACVLGVSPLTLDTPANRKDMPDADHSSWTSLPYVADRIAGWAGKTVGRPESGSIIVMKTEKGTNIEELH